MPEAELPQLETARLLLRHAQPGDEARTLAFFMRNQAHFRPWDPPVPGDFLTMSYWGKNLARVVADFQADRAVRFNILEQSTPGGPIVGRIGFSQIARGPFQSCMLGYQVDAAHEGQGMMFEALTAAIGYMFEARSLHRIQANHIAENLRSAALLKRLGFRAEGVSEAYLFIDGRWRDHVLNALINRGFEWPPVARSGAA